MGLAWFCESCKTKEDVYTIIVRWKNGDRDLETLCAECFMESRYCANEKLWPLIDEIVCDPVNHGEHNWKDNSDIDGRDTEDDDERGLDLDKGPPLG